MIATTEDFQVSLLFALSDLKLSAGLDQFASLCERYTSSPQGFRVNMSVEFVDPSSLLERLGRSGPGEGGSPPVVIVSDRLANVTGTGDAEPSELARNVLAVIAENRSASLVGIAPTDRLRTRDIVRLIRPDHADAKAMFETVRQVVEAMLYKRAPARPATQLEHDDAVLVHAARTREQLRACLQLRFGVYGTLSYLPDAVVSNGTPVEIDCYDSNSVHFAAVQHKTGQVVGTARLALPEIPEAWTEGFLGRVRVGVETQGQWCREIALEAVNNLFIDKICLPSFEALPVLSSFTFPAPLRQELGGPDVAEVSRIIVAPTHRGLGVSRLLMRHAIAASVMLGKRTLLLACVPDHCGMYETGYGFEPIEGASVRVEELDQRAVAMRLDLENTGLNVARDLADRDIAMLNNVISDPRHTFGSRHLCMCRQEECWKDGTYAGHRMHFCPIRGLHRD